MKRSIALAALCLLIFAAVHTPDAFSYTKDSTVPLPGGCPQPNHWNLTLASPLNRRWSTSLPLISNTILTIAAPGTPGQLNEIEQSISASFAAWTGVPGTTFNTSAHPGLIAPLARVTPANSCSNDQQSNADGLNTICFNQPSVAFTTGVLAFTRVITANAPGVSIGASGPAAFAGQILDADTLFRNDNQATYATPAALATPQGQGAYDLESLLAHELGHWFGLDHSAVWRALMFPYAPPPGQFLGDRPTAQAPDGPPLRRRPRRHPLSLSRSRRFRKYRHNQRPYSSSQSFRAREYSSSGHRIIRHGNFRRPCSSRRRRHRLGDRRHPRRLELQCSQPAVAVRRLLRNRAYSYKSQLQNLCRASRRACNARQPQRSAPKPLRPAISPLLHSARRKHKFQPPRPPSLPLIHQHTKAPK